MVLHSEFFFFIWFENCSVAGWDEGVLGMQVGEVARLRVIFKHPPLCYFHDLSCLFKSDLLLFLFCIFGNTRYDTIPETKLEIQHNADILLFYAFSLCYFNKFTPLI